MTSKIYYFILIIPKPIDIRYMRGAVRVVGEGQSNDNNSSSSPALSGGMVYRWKRGDLQQNKRVKLEENIIKAGSASGSYPPRLTYDDVHN